MSTLEYLDPQGNVNFYLVSWTKLNEWLSSLNGNTLTLKLLNGNKITPILPDGLNRGNVIRELEDRRKGKVGGGLRRVTNAVARHDLGKGKDWRDYENAQGYTHLEELFIFQPDEWLIQAREYFFVYNYDLSRVSASKTLRSCKVELTDVDDTVSTILIFMSTSVLALTKLQEDALLLKLSPLDYFFEFQKHVEAYKTQLLREIGKKIKVPRLVLINELDFSKIVGQRLAKRMIRKKLVSYFWGRCDKTGGIPMKQPLSMVFAGPSGSGKTELAEELAELLNRPGDSAFHKVDCAKMTSDHELFGMSGAYQGAKEGSSLNNFVLSISQEPNKIGVVLLDEIDKAEEGVITGLYNVLDKGEWTNKQLKEGSGSQTSIVSCRNIIFIMTVNAADRAIVDYAKRHPAVYTAGPIQMADHTFELSKMIGIRLQETDPFTKAFIGRVGAFVPFLPMAAQTSDTADKLLYEMLTVAKLLIEREVDEELGKDILGIEQLMSPSVKHGIATTVVKQANPDLGVRSIQKEVMNKITEELRHASLLRTGGITRGSTVQYGVDTDEDTVAFRMVDFGDLSLDQREEGDGIMVQDSDLFG